jgi:pyruvate/2-oxoglutarate dehydrogenase complex dihydrolipoamide acyltransferase (E2) component
VSRPRAPRTSGWRRIATGVWRWPTDPQIYGRLDVDARPLIDAIDRIRAHTGEKVTVTHLVVRALGRALKNAPGVNTRVRFGRFVPRSDVSVFVIVTTGAGKDLSGVKIADADRKSAVEVARETSKGASGARVGAGSDLDRAKRMLEALPLPVLRVILRFAAFLTVNMGMDLGRFGMQRESFGSAMVSSVGMFGIREGWAPLSALYRVPLLVLVGEVRPTPWVDDGVLTVCPVVPITVTIDHRWVDAHQIADLQKEFTRYLADPMAFEDGAVADRAPPVLEARR